MADKLQVQGTAVAVITREREDYISLTDIAKHRNSDTPADIVKNWLRNRSTIEFLGLWETLNNPGFKLVEFDQFGLENLNAHFIQEKMPQPERLRKLNEIAIQQVKLLSGHAGIEQLEGGQG